jgi:hypothetical protein
MSYFPEIQKKVRHFVALQQTEKEGGSQLYLQLGNKEVRIAVLRFRNLKL